MSVSISEIRNEFESTVRGSRELVIDLCARLIQANSENPPGDTSTIVSLIETYLEPYPDLEVKRITTQEPVTNLLVRLKGKGPGPRLVFNGHLDTFPIGDISAWSVPPLGGTCVGDRIYGRGSSDMKGGLAASIVALTLLTKYRSRFDGEVVLTLVGDEETGGLWGTQYLLDNVPEARGDAMISGDAGSPQVARFGEKGQLWLELVAQGQSNHGAHVHLGVNAIDRLCEALSRLHRLSEMNCPIPSDIREAIATAASISEAVSGQGESATLLTVTVNVGVIEGGIATNIIPDMARARVDVRFPPGLTVEEIVAAAKERVAEVPGVSISILDASEANVTRPTEEIVKQVVEHANAILDTEVIGNMRPGFSDARFYRYKGIPSVVYGPTPHGMGGLDEYVTTDDLFATLYVHAMAAFSFLTRTHVSRDEV